MHMLHVVGPNWSPTKAYYACRYEILRKPLGFPQGAEILQDDEQAIHAYVEVDGKIVSLGRSHLIPDTSDGAQADFPGQDGPKTPPFSHLAENSNRPAIQIRQMGTLAEFRRQGLAAEILNALENESKSAFGAKCGFLQAREFAIPFYESQGWVIIDDPYSIPNVGAHRSMMKLL